MPVGCPQYETKPARCRRYGVGAKKRQAIAACPKKKKWNLKLSVIVVDGMSAPSMQNRHGGFLCFNIILSTADQAFAFGLPSHPTISLSSNFIKTLRSLGFFW